VNRVVAPEDDDLALCVRSEPLLNVACDDDREPDLHGAKESRCGHVVARSTHHREDVIADGVGHLVLRLK
jgi:hypothetical protein